VQVKCPACNAGFSLESALAVDNARSALLTALAMPAHLGKVLPQYLAMFRAKNRYLSFDRIEKLMADLLPLLDSETVVRDGITRPCSLALWQQAFELMIDHRDAGKLRLPIKTHGYLFEIAFSLADQVDAKAERQVEQSRRQGQHRTSEPANQRQLEISDAINQVRSDIQLKLITPEAGAEILRSKGINPEVLNGR
jgi:hypothetical protein